MATATRTATRTTRTATTRTFRVTWRDCAFWDMEALIAFLVTQHATVRMIDGETLIVTPGEEMPYVLDMAKAHQFSGITVRRERA